MQHVSRIGAYLETGSDFAKLGCLLEDRDIMPCLQEACSRRQSPDPGSGNEDPVLRHSTLLPIAHLLYFHPAQSILLPSQGSGEKCPVG